MRTKTRFTRSILAATLAMAFAAASSTAVAGTATDNINVSASVVASCTIAVSTQLAFGDYDPIVANKSTPLDAQAAIDTTCSTGATPTITLGLGDNAVGSVRNMASGANTLSYEIYTENTHTNVWDDTTGLDLATGTGTLVTTPVYGRVAADQNVAVGDYTDIVVATVTF
jgi:spore coat protein U-like protein